jgi:hypothetical protein
VSRATIESLLLDLSGAPDTELVSAQAAEQMALREVLRICAEANAHDDALADLCRGFAFTSLEIRAFLLCLAPELDAKYQRIFGIINDDLSRRNASLALIASVLGDPVTIRGELARPSRLLPMRVVTAPDNAPPLR